MEQTDLINTIGPQHVLQLAQASVLVVGDLMLDCYLSGSVERVSPEAPVPVVHASGELTTLGGAANVAANAAGLGAKVFLVGIYGDDSRGRELEDLCIKAEVELLNDLRRIDVQTIVKQRIVSGNQQLLRIDWETYEPASPDEATAVSERAAMLMSDQQINVVILSDYAKGTVTDEVARGLIAAARAAGIPIVVDPKRHEIGCYAGATALKPNISEARAYAGLGPEADVADLARAIHRKTDVANVVISMAKDGVGIFPRNGVPRHFASHVIEVADVSGAGDTMIAALATALGAGFEISDAVQLGNVAAGVACSHFGTAVVTANEVLIHLVENALPSQSPHVVRDWDVLHELVELRRRSGARIVFANGCFDLLHGGHIALLEEARRLGDVLVVALNSDASVRQLKGESRPLQTIEDRLRVVAAVRFVDYVTEFTQDTPLDLILTLQPDVIVKGGDYIADQVVGSREASAWGGHVHIVDLIEGLSTTSLISGGAAD